jgi:hypothetical protein
MKDDLESQLKDAFIYSSTKSLDDIRLNLKELQAFLDSKDEQKVKFASTAIRLISNYMLEELTKDVTKVLTPE